MSECTTIEHLLQPAVEAFDCQLYAVERHRVQGKQSLLRVLVTRVEGALTIEDIAKISRQVKRVLEVEGGLLEHEVLEVSSPGLDRPLLKPAHYSSAIGKKISVQALLGDGERKKFQGVLKAISGGILTLELEGEVLFELPMNDVKRARVVPEIGMGGGQSRK